MFDCFTLITCSPSSSARHLKLSCDVWLFWILNRLFSDNYSSFLGRRYRRPVFVAVNNFENNFVTPATTASSKPGQFACHQCGNVYRWKRNLKQHLKMECGKEPSFACPHCPHRSHYRSHLRRHLISKHDVSLPWSFQLLYKFQCIVLTFLVLNVLQARCVSFLEIDILGASWWTCNICRSRNPVVFLRKQSIQF